MKFVTFVFFLGYVAIFFYELHNAVHLHKAASSSGELSEWLLTSDRPRQNLLRLSLGFVGVLQRFGV